jgi:predicted transcriptional regulator
MEQKQRDLEHIFRNLSDLEKEVDTYTLVSFSDVEYSKWLKSKGWKGEYYHIKEYTLFMEKENILAIVKYKNDYPCDRTIWINPSV